MAKKKYARSWWRGIQVDNYMILGLETAEKKAGFRFRYTQGGYNAGGVTASAGTHDGGGAVDIDVRGMSRATINKIVNSLRKSGWAAWYRPYIANLWIAHIHAIQLGNARASSGAKHQIREYKAGRNGLANYGPDTHWRPKKIKALKWNGGKTVAKGTTGMKVSQKKKSWPKAQKLKKNKWVTLKVDKTGITYSFPKNHGSAYGNIVIEGQVNNLSENGRIVVQAFKKHNKTKEISRYKKRDIPGNQSMVGADGRPYHRFELRWGRKLGNQNRGRVRVWTNESGITISHLTSYYEI